MSEAFNMHKFEIYASHSLIEQSYYTVNSYFGIYGVMKQSLVCTDFYNTR